ncbi:Multicopper oxidase with three cupredoxin domains (includes cell division protein FtsP and spore coat protein CotA) [Chitinophaga jiangningensis]|uniref:Multicopper oxidase with three cupredoxin domains (Includes cell division protein FtsP and spore coat protein CotA) n=1 Tax=Chitinophaga jiangningensis TaxID=1419482 RepID=A0A1M7CJ56_9BACT|nr:multicopper oxidase domain-containing protein [Chitinophaga jiangningensis]SHL67298.1 Multicopper oxidase with three cupredoxin domains (includes cell division protein FtsP and spore coat protein CotA) [Chitinophaga jiangningensis]
MKHFLIFFLLLATASSFTYAQSPKTVRYDLYIGDTMVHYSGKMSHALAINGTIPGPVLEFTEGDTALIYVHNTLKGETSIHWHGVILPNQEDGVPYLTTQPIKGGQTHVFKFPVVQHGTYWYHSHTMFQEQSGLYGSLIFHPKQKSDIPEKVLLLSDWSDMHPHQINRYLHTANDWFAIKKGSTQSYTEAVKQKHFGTKITNEWKRMTAMDVSDVYYEKFLANGRLSDSMPALKGGDKVRLRIINGSSSTYFWINFSGGKLSVVANDGADVVPVEVDRLLVGVSETYDVIVTIPEDMRYQLLATAEDRTGSTSLWLGKGMDMPMQPLGKLKYFEGMKMMNDMMLMNGNLDTSNGMQMSNQTMDMNTVMYPEMSDAPQSHSGHNMEHMNMTSPQEIVTLNYGMLKAPEKTTLPKDAPVKELKFELTGNMNRYVWTVNNKTVSESDKILIRKGEVVRMVIFNNTMMRHPMHLHGHFFRVLNGQGEYSPLKTVLDIMPMEVDTIEFAATESGDWFFHCHILYHMMSGMGRVFSYVDGPPNPQVPDPAYAWKMLKKDDRMKYLQAQVGLESNGSDGEIRLSNTRYQLSTEWRVGLNDRHGYESESHFGRYFGKMQWLFPYVGWDVRYRKMDEPEKNLFGQKNTKDFRQVFHIGLQYTLPMLIVADASLDTDGRVRVQLSREDVPISRRLRFNFMVNTDYEYMAGFRYVVTKNFALSTHYDSDMGFGAGITLSY